MIEMDENSPVVAERCNPWLSLRSNISPFSCCLITWKTNNWINPITFQITTIIIEYNQPII